jgi:hypothetical protein
VSGHVEELFDQKVVSEKAEGEDVKGIQANTDAHEV